MTRNITFGLNRKIKMSRNPLKNPLKNLKIRKLQNFPVIKWNEKYIQIYHLRRCRKQVFFLFPHFSSSGKKSWTHFFYVIASAVCTPKIKCLQNCFKNSRKRLGFSAKDGIFGYRNIISKDILWLCTN